MANVIIIKNSSTASATPTTGQLSLGELAINTYDGKLFLKKNDGTDAIVEIGAGGGGDQNVDGGIASSVYTAAQLIDGGTA